MKKFLAIAIAIAVLLAPLYVVNAADARDSFKGESGYVVPDSVVATEAGIQITHFAGIWLGSSDDLMSRTSYAEKVDPSNFSLKFSIDKVADRYKVAPYPWGGGSGYDSWINISLLDTKITWDVEGRANHSGIVFMLQIMPYREGQDFDAVFSAKVFADRVAGNWDDAFGAWWDGNYTTLEADPVGQDFTLTFTRLATGVWEYKYNDVLVGARANFDMQSLDRAFYEGSWTYTPLFTYVDSTTKPDLNLVTYDVAAVTEFKEVGKIYVPGVTAYGKYVGAELEFVTPRGTIAEVSAQPSRVGFVVHGVAEVTEIKKAGEPYVSAFPSCTVYGPELTIYPEVFYASAAPAITAYAQTKMVSYPGVSGQIAKSQKVKAEWTARKLNDKMVLKDVYLKIALSSLISEPFTITLKAINGKSLFKDMTKPIIICPVDGAFYNDPTIDAKEEGEGKITEMWYANDWTSKGAQQTENGTQITNEGQGWLKVKNGTEELSAISKFTVDHTKPVISGVASGTTVSGPVTITVSDDNLGGKQAVSPVRGVEIRWPGNNTFTAKGAYKIVAWDKAGNSSSIAFTIK